MPQLKCEVSKSEISDFEQMMKDLGFTSRYGMTKHCVEKQMKEWRKKKDERGELREESFEPLRPDSKTDEAKPKRRIF